MIWVFIWSHHRTPITLTAYASPFAFFVFSSVFRAAVHLFCLCTHVNRWIIDATVDAVINYRLIIFGWKHLAHISLSRSHIECITQFTPANHFRCKFDTLKWLLLRYVVGRFVSRSCLICVWWNAVSAQPNDMPMYEKVAKIAWAYEAYVQLMWTSI